MSNYILTLQIETFYSLYRFGKISIDRSSLIPVLGQTEDGNPKVDEWQFIKRFPQFVDDDFYVILECDLDPAVPTNLNFTGDATIQELCLSIKEVSDNSPQTFLKIEDVINIFPLTERASIILPGRLKEEISLGLPIFQDLVVRAQQESDKLEISAAALALSSLCGLDDVEKNERLDSVIFDAIQFRKEGVTVSDTDTLLFHSLVYDRHEPFPTSDLGLLYDLNKIMSDIHDMDYTAANFYKYLEKLQKEKKDFSLPELIKLFEGSEECNGIRGKIIEKSDEEKDYVSILLFLKYCDELRRLEKKKGKLSKIDLLDDLNELRSDYSLECRNGVYLLGGFFSYEYFIDDYYAHRKLRILSKPSKISEEKPDKEKNVRRSSTPYVEELTVDEKQEISEEKINKEPIASVPEGVASEEDQARDQAAIENGEDSSSGGKIDAPVVSEAKYGSRAKEQAIDQSVAEAEEIEHKEEISEKTINKDKKIKVGGDEILMKDQKEVDEEKVKLESKKQASRVQPSDKQEQTAKQ